jgi:hypothetical protein
MAPLGALRAEQAEGKAKGRHRVISEKMLKKTFLPGGQVDGAMAAVEGVLAGCAVFNEDQEANLSTSTSGMEYLVMSFILSWKLLLSSFQMK